MSTHLRAHTRTQLLTFLYVLSFDNDYAVIIFQLQAVLEPQEPSLFEESPRRVWSLPLAALNPVTLSVWGRHLFLWASGKLLFNWQEIIIITLSESNPNGQI